MWGPEARSTRGRGAPRWAALVLVVASAAQAAPVVEVSSSTLAVARQDSREGNEQTVIPAYEYLTLRARRLDNAYVDDLGVYVQGWGSIDLAGTRERQGPGADLNLAYVEGALLDRQLSFRAGRQFVVGGAARYAQLDGLTLTFRTGEYGISGWGGAPVSPRFGTSRGDALGGARVFWRRSFDTEVGASFQQVFHGGQTARQELALDARALVLRKVVLTGSAFFVPLESRLSEARAEASWEVSRGLFAAARWQRTAPDLFLPLDSVFTVFVDDERRDGAGGSVSYLPSRRWSIYAEYLRLWGSGATGNLAMGRVAYSPGRYTAGAEFRALGWADDGHVTPRVFALIKPVAGLVVGVDLGMTVLDEPVNGDSLSVTATGTVGWEFARGWRAVAGLVAGTTPFFERRVEAVARLEWIRTPAVREGTP